MAITKEEKEEVAEAVRHKFILEHLSEQLDGIKGTIDSLDERVGGLEIKVSNLAHSEASADNPTKILLEKIQADLGKLAQSSQTFKPQDLFSNKYFWWAIMMVIGFLGAGSGALGGLVRIFTGAK